MTDIAEQLTQLTGLVERGFAAMAEELADKPASDEVREMIRVEVRTEVRAELFPIRETLGGIEIDLRDIKQRLAAVEETVSGLTGYAKELDELRGRIAGIERHLGFRTS